MLLETHDLGPARLNPLAGIARDPSQSGLAGSGPIRPLAMPLWLGAERPGVELGAAALDQGLRERWRARRIPALLDRLEATIAIPVPDPADAFDRLHRRTLEFVPEVAAGCAALAESVAAAVSNGELALTLGGDHALTIGSLAGAARAAANAGDRVGVLWFDTHGDLNTPATSPSGHLHGMAIAAALGLDAPALGALGRFGPSVRPEDVCLLGGRDLDPAERDRIADLGIWTLTMEEWTDAGIVSGVGAALDHLAARRVAHVHVSFDLDVLDPTALPGTGTAVPGGLTVREASQVLRRLRAWPGPIRSVDWVELNPLLDPSGRSTETAVALLGTLLGETAR
ncbi:MAG: Arginase [uncultured Thermomicrobiales bacterium]|uniref:Arginase n=1 Tax=uncultured Thermomicrobiales bacterium TaxID=1645740 RepID=A0A6J4UAL4_9BACT|nr:MAG: Arginase [uncultured Thermomicrobiales bacterium]